MGMIVFNGVHYITVFRDADGLSWRIFDDVKTTKIDTWPQLILKLCDSQMYPTKLFYLRGQNSLDLLGLSEADRLRLLYAVQEKHGNDTDREGFITQKAKMD
jgi:hypothetical protein